MLKTLSEYTSEFSKVEISYTAKVRSESTIRSGLKERKKKENKTKTANHNGIKKPYCTKEPYSNQQVCSKFPLQYLLYFFNIGGFKCKIG